jgi:hypothetical protein
MANTKNFIAKNGVSTGDGYAMPDVRPSLLLDFANSKTLDPRITFTRGSTATYWDGKTTAKAEENLAERSENFANAYWTKSDVTVTEGATAPDGSTTAATMQATLNGDTTQAVYHLMSPVPQIGASLSVYAKEGTTEFFSLQAATSNPNALFNLNTGAVLHHASCTATITSVGNGWYRCALENLTSAGDYIIMSPVGSDIGTGDAWGNNDAQAGDNVLIWGVQLENRSSPTAYTATGGSPIVKYQPVLQTAASGEARFDHDPVTGESKGLLIEEARTNYLTDSETAAFSFSNVYSQPFLYNTVIAPDGTQTADTVTGPETDPSSRLEKSLTFSSGTKLTLSFYQKTIWGSLDSSANPVFPVSNSVGLTTEAVVSEDVGNGWYRLHYVMTTTASSQTLRLYYSSGVTNADIIALWGFQLEQGAFPTSYIPTSGSTVTRAVDSALMIGSNFTDWFNNEESTVFVDFERRNANQSGTYPMIAALSDGTTDNVLSVYLNNGETFFYETRALSSTNAILSTTITTQGSAYKVAGTLKTNDMAASFDGATVTTDTDALNPPNINRLDLGSRVSYLPYTGTIKKFAYYPQRLSNATLQAMTEE